MIWLQYVSTLYTHLCTTYLLTLLSSIYLCYPLAGVSKHSGGCMHHFPLYQKTKQHMVESLTNCFKRYLVRKIGFEAVMRVRCTRGLQVHTFHGNFFVRSTDLLSLPNINPDAGYGMQVSAYSLTHTPPLLLCTEHKHLICFMIIRFHMRRTLATLGVFVSKRRYCIRIVRANDVLECTHYACR